MQFKAIHASANTTESMLIQSYASEMHQELENILNYWLQYTIDEEFGGFVGQIDQENKIIPHADKGAVLNSRILWTFSASYKLLQKEKYLQNADRACHYLLEYFFDKKYGGVFWSVDFKGTPVDTKKHIYALAFAVYGLAEYYSVTKLSQAKDHAISLYDIIIEYSYDRLHRGFIEALAQDWQPLKNFRLSGKDANEPKSMNTHLHLLEAFTNLYRIWPDEQLKKRIVELIRIFIEHIIHPDTHHLILFFDDSWNPKSDIISFGHNIEASWLMCEAAETIDDERLEQEVNEWSVKIAFAASKGLDRDGGLWYEQDGDRFIKEKHWWPQSEAMIGFYNAWQLTGNKEFLDQSVRTWKFVQTYLLDSRYGEWFWGVDEHHRVMPGEDKVGIWKCPYHNSRACLEIIRRSHFDLNNIHKNSQLQS